MLTWVLRLYLGLNYSFPFYVCLEFIVCEYLLLLSTLATPGCNGNGINVMITNNPNPCITNCVMQGLSKMFMSGNGTHTFTYLSSCRQSGAEQCWKGLLPHDPTWLCVWGSRVLWKCQGAGMYSHQGPSAGMFVYCLVSKWARLSLQKLFYSRKEIADTCCRRSAKNKSVSCVV